MSFKTVIYVYYPTHRHGTKPVKWGTFHNKMQLSITYEVVVVVFKNRDLD